jgi:hypothetical protein
MKLRIGVAAAITAATLALAGTAGSAAGPSDQAGGGPDLAAAVLWAKYAGDQNMHRGEDTPVDLSFKNSEPFPDITFGFTDSAGKHWVAGLTFEESTPTTSHGYHLVVPANFPNGKLKLQSIVIRGYSLPASGPTVGTHVRSKEYVGVVATTGDLPYERVYNIDFTKLDINIS